MGPRKVRRGGRPVITNQPTAQPVRSSYAPKRYLWLRRVVLAAVAVALLAGLLFGLKIQSIAVTPTEYSDALGPQAESAINQHPLWRNLLFLPSGTLSKQLEVANQTLVGKITVHKSLLSRSITLEVGDRTPVLRWQTEGKTFTLDAKGVVIEQTTSGDNPQLPLVVDASNLPVEINKVAASSQFVGFTSDVWANITKLTSLEATAARVADTTNEVQVSVSQGFYIRFDTTRSALDQLDEVKRVLEKDKPAQYLDVRLPYKAYYR